MSDKPSELRFKLWNSRLKNCVIKSIETHKTLKSHHKNRPNSTNSIKIIRWLKTT